MIKSLFNLLLTTGKSTNSFYEIMLVRLGSIYLGILTLFVVWLTSICSLILLVLIYSAYLGIQPELAMTAINQLLPQIIFVSLHMSLLAVPVSLLISFAAYHAFHKTQDSET